MNYQSLHETNTLDKQIITKHFLRCVFASPSLICIEEKKKRKRIAYIEGARESAYSSSKIYTYTCGEKTIRTDA